MCLLSSQVYRSTSDPQTGPLSYPRRGVVSELDLPRHRGRPLPRASICASMRLSAQRRVGLPLEGVGAVAPPAIRPGYRDLITARWQLTDVAETPVSFPARHQATRLRADRHRIGSTRPALMNSAKGSFADPHMTADLDELDPSFRDQAPDEPRLGPKPPAAALRHIEQRRCRSLPGPSCRPPRCRKITVRWHRRPAPGLVECGLPSEPVSDGVQQPPGVVQVIRVGRGDGFPGVPGRVGCRNTEGPQQPVLAVGAVVGQGLAGPLARDQDPPPGIAEVIGVVGLALAPAGGQAGPGVLGLDAVPEPVRAPRRARLIPQRLSQPGRVIVLRVGVGLVAVADLLGEVLGQVADAPGRVRWIRRARPGRRTGPRTGPRATAQSSVADGIERLVPGRQHLAGGRVEVAADLLVPDGQLVARRT